MANNILKLLSPLALIFVLSAQLTNAQNISNCDANGMKKFDELVAKIVTFGNSGRKFPEGKGAPLKKYCDESEKMVKQVERYKDTCFKDLSKQVFGVLIYSVKNAIKQFCKKDTKALTELLAATPCVNANNKEVTRCYSNAIDGFIGAENAVETKRIPHVCCEYSRMFECFGDKLPTLPKCTPKHVDVASNFIRNILGNVVDLICGEYTEGSDKCEKLGPAPKKTKAQRRMRSFAIPLLNVLASFKEA